MWSIVAFLRVALDVQLLNPAAFYCKLLTKMSAVKAEVLVKKEVVIYHTLREMDSRIDGFILTT